MTQETSANNPTIAALMPHMAQVRDYSASLEALSERWNLLTLLGQMSNIGMDMTATRAGFQDLTQALLHHLSTENLKKTVAEIRAKAQVTVDIVIRNLFERTADIGFLATDDDFREFISQLGGSASPEQQTAIKARFKEYVAKYSVYDNIILLSPDGQVLAQFDDSNPVTQSHDPLIHEAINTSSDYVEVFRATDLDPRREQALIYAYRITASNAAKSQVLGVLCLVFRFEDEMVGVFRHLIQPDDWMVLTLLDREGRVIASSDEYHIPTGAPMHPDVDTSYRIARFAGREYLAATCATQGYQGYAGPGWLGHVMVPLTYAFANKLDTAAVQIDERILDAVMRRSRLFSEDLRTIPRQADKIQKELDVTVWNGNVRIANTKSGENSFSKSLLGEISKTGARTKDVFEESIGKLNQTVVSSLLTDVQFRAALAIDIMDRNLYERANDCRWWALTSFFRKTLAQESISTAEQDELRAILSYINNLYTVYTNLVLYDRSGTIVAVSNPEFEHKIGTALTESWVIETLAIRDSQVYSVSAFAPSWLYNNRYTYIYGASVSALDDAQQIVGGIGIVFDSEPQFSAMLRDALPRTERGEISPGCFAVFADAERQVIASSQPSLPPGTRLELDPEFFTLSSGACYSSIVEYQGAYYAVGAHASSGYREYKGPTDRYRNAVTALVFTQIGTMIDSDSEPPRPHSDPTARYPQPSGNEPTTDISTFVIGGRLFGVESREVYCSVNDQEITPLVGANPRFIGVFSLGGQTVGVVSLADLLGLEERPYCRETDGILVVRLPRRAGIDDQEGLMGLVIERIKDSPEIPNRSIDRYDSDLAGKSVLTKAVIRPEPGWERTEMLSILDVSGLERHILKAGAEARVKAQSQHNTPLLKHDSAASTSTRQPSL